MALVDINWNPSRKELRVFSSLLICFGVVVSAILSQRLDSALPSLIVVSTTTLIGVVGLIGPSLVRPIYVVWMALAFPIGWTVSHLMMAIVYYLVLTPIGLIMRMCGRDPMQRRIDRTAKTYWQLRTAREDIKSYFRQY